MVVRSSAAGYGIAVAALAAVVFLRWLLDPLLGDALPLVTLYGAVAVAVWVGGYRPAILVVALGYVACAYLFIEPRGSLGLSQTSSLVGLFAYLITCSIIIGLGEAMRMAQRRAEVRRDTLRVTLASMGDAVITTDRDGCVTFMNAVAESLTGWRQEEAAGQSLHGVFRIVNEQTHKTVESPVTRSLRQGVIVGLANHTVLIRKDGAERPIDDSAAPIQDAHGQVVGCVLIFRDITERRRLEKQLADRLAASRFLASIVESSEDAIVSKSLDGIIQSWNAAAERLFGYTAEQAVGRHISLIIPSDRGDEEERILERIRAGERVDHFETVRMGSDGQPINISLTVSPIKDEAGQVIGASKIVRDITERQHAEAAIMLLNAQLASDLESMARMQAISTRMVQAGGFSLLLDEILNAAIGITSSDMGNIQLFEGKTLRIVSQRGFEASFLDFFNAVHEGQAVCGTALHNRKRVIVEDVMDSPIFAGNPALDVLLTAGVRAVQSTPLVRRSGQMLGMFSTHYRVPRRPSESQLRMLDLLARLAADLIESKQAEERLRAKDAQLENITENTSVLLTHCSRDLRYIFANRPYSEFLGKPHGEIVGRPIVDVMGHEAFETIRPFVDRVLRGEIVEFESEVPYESLGPRFMHARYVPDTDGNGEVIGWFASVTDITDRKHAEMRIYDLMAELKDADRRKDEFLAVLAHELRNPLAPLRNMLEIMKRAEGDGDLLRQAQRTMERQLGQLVPLVDDLIDVSRITRGKIELRKEHVELASIIHQAVEACLPLADGANQQMTVTLPPDPIFIHADPVRLVQVFSNILNNACKYSKPGDCISVTAERQGSDVTVTVTDTGMGIPPDKLSTVFEMFTQVDRTLERSQGGLGIGLTLVKRLVGMHGGTVTARSEGTGRGSEFAVRLPVLIVQPEAESSQPISESGKTTARRFLVVDDNTDAASSLAKLLEITGNETHTARDGLEAVEAAEEFRPDVVLLDIGLPKMNGYDACRRIREQPWSKGMLLVALTGWGQDDDRRKSHEAGFDHHLIKPVDYAVLMKLLADKQPTHV